MNHCSIARMHHLFKLQYNKLDSNDKPDLPSAFIDDIVYQACLDYVEIFSGANQFKAQKFGFEVTQIRIDMLQSLLIPYSYQLSNPITENNLLKYTVNLEYPYFHMVRATAKHNCGNANVSIEQHDDINTLFSNSYDKPSTKWNDLIGVIQNNNFIIYSDSELTNVYGEYIKTPTKPFIGGYDTLEFIEGDSSFPSSNSQPIDTDIPQNYCNTVVRIAIMNMAETLADYNFSQTLQNKLLTVN